MKQPLILLLALVLSVSSYGQRRQNPKIDFAAYFTLKAEQPAGVPVLMVYPRVVRQLASPLDQTGRFIKQNHRRFEYLLQNKTKFIKVYNHLYPDTLTISKLYTDSLQHNQTFQQYYRAFTEHLTQPTTAKNTNPIISQKEMMQVASKFFYCDEVAADTTVQWHVCIGFNGLKDIAFDKDYTLLEAFCFEAVFANMLSKDPNKPDMMGRFVNYVKTSTDHHRQTFTSNQELLQKVKQEVFTSMELDEQLKLALLSYYREHESNLPFQIN